MNYSKDEEIDFLRESIKIFAPSWKEKAIVELLKNIFDDFKDTIEIDDIGNFKVTLGKGKPVLMLASHMDTISQPLEFREDEENIYGRGAVDCRSSLISMALAAHRAASKDLKGTIIFTGIVAEEVTTKGVEFILKDLEKPDFAIFGEPTAQKICIAYKGRVWLQVVITLSPGHSSAPWIYLNGFEILYEFYTMLNERLQGLIKHKKLSPFYTPRATITTINSDNIPNMLPEEVNADVDIRIPPTIKETVILDIIDELVEKLDEKYKKMDPRYNFEFIIKSVANGIRVQTNNDLCKDLSDSVEEVIGEKTKFVKKTGTCFMNNIGNYFSCPIVTYGPGDPSLEHTKGEFIPKKEFIASVEILEKTIEKLMS
ncbi:MAG: M20/M25/M40 family metallo-hydrolase [Candidatus Hodarchaeota archaeon]